ncbi:low molecular weight protein arginine phosphatase [Ruficoccus sp. ZRK36]|uniref:arsenate reductase/protein-tyrosine-phosphatase family protein n=1 Tax=Ruficoccus sp. ZRK36 TaxID=2866311 RepID=UPI001C73AE52|nr:low molecular weight protein arginine phosphatase [Ruficoccus sp. ZRK36]QYY34558.1 low molecular weight protein arginine phosphatase [Ruficoccus sp. ZRK36]
MADRNHVTVVCTANICRSPMGEKLLAHALQAEAAPLNAIVVDSAGVSAFSGEPASVNSVRALKKVGLDASSHQSQGMTQSIIDRSLAIFCMTESHRSLIDMQFQRTTPHIYLFRELMGGGAAVEIPDPFGSSLPAYEAARDSMVEAVPSIVAFLKEHYDELKNPTPA